MSDVRNFGSMALALTSLPSATCLASAGAKSTSPRRVVFHPSAISEKREGNQK